MEGGGGGVWGEGVRGGGAKKQSNKRKEEFLYEGKCRVFKSGSFLPLYPDREIIGF